MVASNTRFWVNPSSAALAAASLRKHLRPSVLAELIGILNGERSDEAPTCSARSQQTGERCQNPIESAALVCYAHGGAAPQVEQAAAIRRSFADALATTPEASPPELMREALHVMHVDARLALDRVLASSKPADYIRMTEAWLTLFRMANQAENTGLVERLVRIQERDAAVLRVVIAGVLGDFGHDVQEMAVRASVTHWIQEATGARAPAIEGVVR